MSHLKTLGAATFIAGLLVIAPGSATGRSTVAKAGGPLLGVVASTDDTAPPNTGRDATSAPVMPRTLIPAATAGVTYRTFEGVTFRPDATDDGSSKYVTGGGISPAASGWYTVHLDLPQGARVTELAWYVTDNSVANNIVLYLYHFDQSGVGGTSLVYSATTGYSATIQTLTDTTNILVDNTNGSYLLYAYAPAADAAITLYGVRVGYVDPTPGFVPVTPTRVYDSRWSSAGGAVGVLDSGQNRLVSVANGRSSAGITVPNLVPAGARAIVYNLTVTGTKGAGYLAVVPGNVLTSTSSSINYFAASQTLANGGTVSIDPATRQIRVFCGGKGTHFVIDITGYYL